MTNNLEQKIFEEKLIIQLISEGASNAEIGGAMFLCESSIKKRIKGMFKKYKAKNRAHLVGMAMRKEIHND